ncbi:MAG: hypothetical protein AMJ79_02605, partial [Phycisphaerae bacterium SM23_30]
MNHRTNLNIYLLTLIFLLGISGSALGQIIYVDDDAAPGGNGQSWATAFKYLQDALDAATSGEIWVAEGIYKPDQGGGQTSGDRFATFQLINGVGLYGGYAGYGTPNPYDYDPSAYETILSGDLNGNDIVVLNTKDLYYEETRYDNSYTVVTGTGTDETSILDGFTITGGHANRESGVGGERRGGGVFNDWNEFEVPGNPTINNCVLTGNAAWLGGGMYNYNGSSPTITNCTFIENAAIENGGAVQNAYSNPTFSNCTFISNWAYTSGGGIFNHTCNPTLTQCVFTGNVSWTSRGGGMYNYYGNPMLTDCTFSDNSARVYGGGIYNHTCSPMLTNCTFSSNLADSQGGGIRNYCAHPTLTNCIFKGNMTSNGGGMYNYDSDPTLTNCTFSDNSAGNWGGGIYNYNSSPVLTNCILWGNIDSEGEGLGETAQIHVVSGTPVVNYSCINDDDPDDEYIYPGTGNIDDDPLFVDIYDPEWVAGTEYNLRLLPGSPGIDAGDNLAVPASITTDLDGNPRFADDPDTPDTGNGTPPIVDMGAYEGPRQRFFLSTILDAISEGQTVEFTVNLAKDPLGTVQVMVGHQSGDPDIMVVFGATLTFDSSNYYIPQTVTLAAAEDSDNFSGRAFIQVSAPGIFPAVVTIFEEDNDPVISTILYVDDSAPGANTGASWADAYNELRYALNAAAANPEVQEIRVAQGIYKPAPPDGMRTDNFYLINGVTLYGGYAGYSEPNPDDRDPGNYVTILSGDLNGDDVGSLDNPSRFENSYNVVETWEVINATAVLDGFTITGGYANGPKGGDRAGSGMLNPDG